MAVIQPRAIPAPTAVLRSGVNPKLHMVKFAAAANPIVALIGDSVSVGTNTTMPMTVQTAPAALANPVFPSEVFWNLLKRRLRADNPAKNISFMNFAVSGQGWINLSGAATANWPTWYTPTSANWLSFVQTAAPDLIVIALGANDMAGLNANHIRDALTVIASWTKVPDIILVAPWHAYLGGGSLTQVNYQGQRGNAAFIRGMCYGNSAVRLFNLTLPPLGLIDLGRYQQIVSDGTDPQEQYLTQVLKNVSLPSGGNYTLPQTPGDFALDITWPANAGAFNFPGVIIDTGYQPNKSYWNIFNSGGTGVGCQLTYAGTSTINTTTRTSGNIVGTTKDINLQISCRGSLWLAIANGVYFVDEFAPRFMDTFAPIIKPYSSSTNPYTINSYCIGTPIASQSGVSQATVVGTLNGPTGGNGNNHPDSRGLEYLYAGVLNQTDFCAG